MLLPIAISLGFLGSFHCVGMCGPIALSLPVNRSSTFNVITGSLVYNFGRIITYSLMGLIVGLVGKGFALAGWQNILSISLGIAILLLFFLPRLSILTFKPGLLFQSIEKLKSTVRQLFGKYNFRSLLLIGVLNGLLPCGLVYMGIAGSMATADPFQGALFMSIFGIGTFPAMIVITVVKDFINIRFREQIRKTIPVFVGAMAVLLILRGMNLGIPYVSPGVEKTSGGNHYKFCHK